MRNWLPVYNFACMADPLKKEPDNRLLLRYAGLTMQILLGLGAAVWIGIKADKWFRFSTPLLVWILPLLVITSMIYQIIKDTSNKK